MVKGVIIGLVAMLLSLQFQLWAGDKNVFDLRYLRLAAKAAELENQQLLERNVQLMAEVLDLKLGGEAVESLARQELGFIKDGETFFQVIN